MTGADGAGQPASVVSDVPAAGSQDEGAASAGGAAQALGHGGSATIGTVAGVVVSTAPITPTMPTTTPTGLEPSVTVICSVTGPLGGADHLAKRPFRRFLIFEMAF